MIEQEKPKTAAACRHLTDNGLEEIQEQSMGALRHSREAASEDILCGYNLQMLSHGNNFLTLKLQFILLYVILEALNLLHCQNEDNDSHFCKKY